MEQTNKTLTELPVYNDGPNGSDLRQIPNNQEVFLFPHSDTALVLEILEMVEEGDARGDLWEAAKCVYVPSLMCVICLL